MKNVHQHIAKKVELAQIYADDGAFLTAATILRKLAADLDKYHADTIPADYTGRREASEAPDQR